ncbi:MAG: mercury(II) reductase [Gemmatimonadaceae bacterium]
MSDQTTTFGLLVIGGGSAGFAAAIKGADLGARVAIVEGSTLGGTCVNVGCIPSKTLLRAAEARHKREHHGFAGIPTSDGAANWADVREQKNLLVETLRRDKYEHVLKSYESVTLVRQRATFRADRTVQLSDGQVLRGDKIVIATGASPWLPPIPGLNESEYLDNATAMSLERLPQSLVVIGGGAVGLELAQMFSRLGADVTVIEVLDRLVAREEPAISEALAESLRAEGLTIHTGVSIDRVTTSDGRHSILLRDGKGPRTVSAEQVLVAAGRRANTRGLGLENPGIALTKRGEIVVDEFLQTTVPNIYAAGDVIGEPMFVYVAAYAGNLATENALGGNSRRYDLFAVPSVTFTDPAVASVGLTESAARQRGVNVLVSQLALEHVPRARAAHDTRGFIRLVADGKTRKIIGAHVVAAEAGELISEAALSVRLGLTIEELAGSFHPYLTLSEGLKLAAQTFTTDVSKLSCCAA